MFFSPYEAQMVMEERLKDSLRKAEQERLRRVVNPARLRFLDRVLASIGGLLLSAGKRLQGRYALAKTGLTGSPSPARQ